MGGTPPPAPDEICIYNSLSPEIADTSIRFGVGDYRTLGGGAPACYLPSMGTKTVISPEEYLAMHFPDREPEYVHGELKEKALPDSIHSDIQAMLMHLLWGVANRYELLVRAEVRCRVAVDKFRLPDVALFPASPYEKVPSTPCIMTAGIVSEDERRLDLMAKLRDLAEWGVPNIWIIDPWLRRLAVWQNDTEVPVEALTLPEYSFEVRLEELIKNLPL